MFPNSRNAYSGRSSFAPMPMPTPTTETPEPMPMFVESDENRVHFDAINEHLRYIYERLEDANRRIEYLEKFHLRV